MRVFAMIILCRARIHTRGVIEWRLAPSTDQRRRLRYTLRERGENALTLMWYELTLCLGRMLNDEKSWRRANNPFDAATSL